MFLLSLFTGMASADDLSDGVDAFHRMDYEAAIEQMTALAEDDPATANYYLGLMRDPAYHRLPSGKYYQMGYFDVPQAIESYQAAIESGNPYAMHRLAELYLLILNSGWTGYVDDVGNLTSSALNLRRQALPLLRERMEQGDGIAAYLLAESRRDEPFFFVAMEQARALLEIAALSGDSSAQLYMGKTYLFPRGTVVGGEGFTFDPVDAFAWFTVAAKAHNYHASVYQVEAAEALPIRDHRSAEDQAHALMGKIPKAPAVGQTPPGEE